MPKNPPLPALPPHLDPPAGSWVGRPESLSEALQHEVKRRIISGELAPDSRINEVELSTRLAVSRTPLREALSQLCGEGFVHQIPRRGFFVAELSAAEVRELYPIRQLLDPEALRLSGLPARDELERLTELNRRIANEDDPRAVIELDDQFHLALVSRCGNRLLLDLIEQHMARTRRYEYAYFSSGHHVTVATSEHEEILTALAEGNLDRACQALKQNMTSATTPLIEWLENREPAS
jgi:DNA-binding GntR family transcriptional regulator